MRWALAQLDLPLVSADGVERLPLPEADQTQFDGKAELRLALDNDSSADDCEPIDLDSRFGQWLLERLHQSGPAVPMRPAEQPSAVNDITERLFHAYAVDGGRIHIGGCQLSDYPFLRLSFVASRAGETEIRHVFVAHDGSSLSDELVHDLGLDQVEPILSLPPRIDDTALAALVTAGRRVAAQSSTSRDPDASTIEPVAIAVVWVKNASGQLQFTIGDTTVSHPFSGWTRLLQAKPYTSPKTGASSFHLAATDDGRIDCADQIAVCQQSGQRVLKQELVTCSVTGKQVLEEFTETCPVTGRPCLSDEFAVCPMCRERVSKAVLIPSPCQACRQIAKIKKDDPRLVWILGEHTGLDRWKQWQLAETKTVYIAVASSWTKKLLVVVDKETLAVHHMATASKLSSAWTPVEASRRDELLR